MLEILKQLAGQSRPATSSQLKDALASIDEAALSAALAKAGTARNDALLSGDEKRLERAEIVLANARRDLDRARAAREALTSRIAEAEEREAQQAIDAERAELEKLAESVAADLKKIYPRASREIADVLERLVEVEGRISEFNSRTDGERIAPAEWRALPLPASLSDHYTPIHSLIKKTSLRPCSGSSGWGSARVEYATLGVKF